jgi:hypothetical protein
MGNGFSASLSAESRRTTQIIGGGTAVGNPIVLVGGIPFSVPKVALARWISV